MMYDIYICYRYEWSLYVWLEILIRGMRLRLAGTKGLREAALDPMRH